MKGNEQFLICKASTIHFVIDEATLRIISVTESEKAFQIFGFTEEEFIEMRFPDLIPERDLKYFSIQEIIGSRKRIRRIRNKDGSEFLVYLKIKKADFIHEDQYLCEIETLADSNRISREDLSGLVFRHITKSKLGFIVWNSKLEVIHWSEKVERITGFSFDSVYGRSVLDLDFVSSNEKELLKKSLFKALDKRKENFKIKVNIHTKEAAERRVRLHFSLDWDEDTSKVESLMCLVEDITESYLQQAKLRESEQRYRSLFESSSEGVLICRDGSFFDCNKRAEELFKCSRAEIIGKHPAFFSPELQPDGRSSAEMAEQFMNNALTSDHQSFEWTHKTVEGDEFYTEINLSKIKVDEQIYLQAIIKDITQRKKYEQKLIESEKLFRDLFLNSPTAMVMVDNANHVEMVNQSFLDLFGFEKAEIAGKELDPFIVDDSQMEEAPKMPAIGHKPSELTHEVVRYDKWGNKKNLIVSAIPVLLDGQPFKGFGLYVDITDLKEKEHSIQRSLDEKKILLAEIHHRVKNNLALISGLLQLHAMKINDPKTREVLNESESRVRSIAAVHELLYQSSSFSRIPSKEYILGIVKQLNSMFPDDVQIRANTNDFEININQAIPLGLLINEILLEYSDREYDVNGIVELDLNQIAERIHLEIKVCGKMDSHSDQDDDLSPLLIDALTNQLGAEVEIRSNGNNTLKITFPVSDAPGAASSLYQ
jgi:PAS domain S-box-containing protein